METDKKRKTYEQQFKIDAVNLVVNGNRSVSSVARDLGIEVNVLHRWKRELTEGRLQAFPGKGRSIVTNNCAQYTSDIRIDVLVPTGTQLRHYRAVQLQSSGKLRQRKDSDCTFQMIMGNVSKPFVDICRSRTSILDNCE